MANTTQAVGSKVKSKAKAVSAKTTAVKTAAKSVAKKAVKKEFDDIEFSPAKLADKIITRFEDLKDQALDAADSSTEILKRYPLYALVGALTVGVAAGWALRGRRSLQ